jgi:hypothetical protein
LAKKPAHLALPYSIGTSEEFMLVIVGYLILIAAIMGVL